ncbi:MAG: heme-dependent oxidative N-demethylase subunit alpha family protein [Caldimonas sp.]
MPFDFSLITAPFRMQPGLRRVAAGQSQLTPSRPNGRHLREKLAVLATTAHEALLAVPGFDAAPAFRAIAREAARATSPAFEFESENDCGAPHIGWALQAGRPEGDGEAAIGQLLAALPGAQRAATLLCLAFEEDFAIIDGASATLPWLAVCLPSRWAPEEKIGRHFAEVHAPVADNTLLIEAGERLARLVTGSERWERFVWTISADPRLHQHPGRGKVEWPEGAQAEAVAALASLRHEHQTFIPVPGTGQAVFTIRIASEPLDLALRTRDDAARLHDALASMSAAVLAYRGLTPVRDRLLEALRRRIDALPAAA